MFLKKLVPNEEKQETIHEVKSNHTECVQVASVLQKICLHEIFWRELGKFTLVFILFLRVRSTCVHMNGYICLRRQYEVLNHFCGAFFTAVFDVRRQEKVTYSHSGI